MEQIVIEMLMVAQLVKKNHAFYATRQLISVFTCTHD